MKLDKVAISSVNMRGLVSTIYACPISFPVCPICGGKLQDYMHAIQVSYNECVKMKGLVCFECDAFFSSQRKLVRVLDNKHSHNNKCKIRYDFDVHYDTTYYTSLFSNLKSIFCQITICMPRKISTYSIVTSIHEEDIEKNILHYSNRAALDLLTAIVMKDSGVPIDGEDYIIQKVRWKATERSTDFVHILKPFSAVEVYIKQNGGYYENNPSLTIVNGLVLCEKSKKLEVLPVSYDKERDMYYVDRQVYENFRKSRGLPIVRHVKCAKKGWIKLSEESLLHQLGYNVSARDNFSDAERHRMLGRFVELGFTDVHSIVCHLTYLIELNKNTHTQITACEKWKNDLAYIRSYKVSPEGLVFLSKIKKFNIMGR